MQKPMTPNVPPLLTPLIDEMADVGHGLRVVQHAAPGASRVAGLLGEWPLAHKHVR